MELRGSRKAPYRLAVLVSHPIQYFAPLFRRLAQHPEIDLTVLYSSLHGANKVNDPGFGVSFAWDIPLLDGYRYKLLKELRRKPWSERTFGAGNSTVIRELRRGRYDAVWIHGYMGATNWLAILTALATHVPILMRGDSHLLNRRPLARRLAKEAFLRLLFRRAAGLYIGSANKEFYLHYKLSNERLYFSPFTVDNDFFRRWAERLRPQRQAIRAKWGILDNRPVILFAGKLISVKQPFLLLEAYRQVRRHHECALLFAGDGPLREALERKVAEGNIPDVHVTGFLNQREMPKAYTAGDILVLPSVTEQWGLAVNEAMNFSLPVVVSDRVGCAADLVRSGENGYVFPHDSCRHLEQCLSELVGNSGRRASYGSRSSEIIENWGLNQTVSGVVQAVKGCDRRELSGR